MCKNDKSALFLGKNKDYILPNRSLAHLTGAEMLSHDFITKELFKDYFKFSIVRNPVSRLFSFYQYLGYESVITFDVFIRFELEKLIQGKKYGFFFKTQTDFLFDSKANTNLMDFTGRFENLETDFKKILDTLNLPDARLKHENKGELSWNLLRGFKKIMMNPMILPTVRISKNKSMELTKKSRALVSNIYKQDFDNFGYSF